MEKPLGIYIFGLLYLVLGIMVIVGYIYLLVVDFSIITFEPYNAADVQYSAQAQDFMLRYALGPVLFVGGFLAVPGSILILTKEEQNGFYLMLLASVAWTLLIIGLLCIWYFLRKDIKDIYLN